jgi:hypothetical protein
VSRVIGFVYSYTFYVTSFLSLLSIIAFLGGVATLKCAAAGSRCTVPFGKVAAGRPDPLSPAAERCGASIGRVGLVIRS